MCTSTPSPQHRIVDKFEIPAGASSPPSSSMKFHSAVYAMVVNGRQLRPRCTQIHTAPHPETQCAFARRGEAAKLRNHADFPASPLVRKETFYIGNTHCRPLITYLWTIHTDCSSPFQCGPRTALWTRSMCNTSRGHEGHAGPEVRGRRLSHCAPHSADAPACDRSD